MAESNEFKDISQNLIYHSSKVLETAANAIDKVEKANKRLFIICIALCIAIPITVCVNTGLHTVPYFYSNYQYPTTTTTQEVKQNDQSITQTIGDTSPKGGTK